MRILLLLIALTSCATQAHENAVPASPDVRQWGAMRTVMRDGRTEGRVELSEIVGPNTIAVGALAGLAAEITVVDGRAHLAEVVDASSTDGLRLRLAAEGDRATLLVAADVREWSSHSLGPVTDLRSLEGTLASTASTFLPGPFPFRIEGRAKRLELHVLDHSCPIAAPEGPEPWRYSGEDVPVQLIGFYAENSGGQLTHHGQTTHIHALLPETGLSGHVDAVALSDGARLFLPAR